MDIETTESVEEINFGKEIAKSFVQSTAISAGTLVGFMVVGLAIAHFNDYKEARKAKKDQQ